MTESSLIVAPFAVAALVVAATACLAVCLLILADRQLRRLPRGLLSVFLLSAAIATVSAQKANTNSLNGGSSSAPQSGIGHPPVHAAFHFSPFALSPLTGGFRLDGVATNEEYSYAMPTNGEVRGTWHLRGAYDDVTRVGLEGFTFPLGSELVTSLWASTLGLVRPHLASPSNEVAAVGAPMSAIPGVSRFWTAPTPSNTYLLTWQDFAPDRVPLSSVPDSSSLVSAQLELRANGDFVARSNDVAYVCRRVNPDDWDGDGWLNDEDANPDVFDGGGFGPHQELPEGDDTNYYYWVDLVVSQANARVTFVGDGDSHLPDPDFIARAGETNRVMLLIGKPYEVRCAMPMRIVGMEDEEIEALEGEGSASVVWPVHLEFVSLSPMLMSGPRLMGAHGGGGTGVAVHPTRAAGGAFSWPDNFCCYLLAPDNTPVFACDGTCGCGGCSTGDITYEIGGHRMSYGGIDCGCSHGEGAADDPSPNPDGQDDSPSGPAVSVSFSKSAVIFEDAYTNSPGVVVNRRSTDTELTCEVYGGTNGGNYAFAIYNGERLLRKGGSYLPRSGTVAAGETFRIKIRYEAQSASGGEGDITARGTFTENGTGAQLSQDTTLTAVKVSVVADADFPLNKSRHVFGPKELFSIQTEPSGWGVYNIQVPIAEGSCNTNIAVCGQSHEVAISVVHPSSVVRGEFVRVMTQDDWYTASCDPLGPGVVGAGFIAKWYLEPSYVSFGALEVHEGSAPVAGRWGCFTNEAAYPSEVYEHNVGAGAGRVVQVQTDNQIGAFDSVGVQLGLPPSVDGGFSLAIPVFWAIPNEQIERLIGSLIQYVSVTSNGTTTIGKGSLSTTRGAFDE